MPSFAFGSNGWVVAPSKSKTGNALFAFDSHDAFGLPNLFYEVHLFFAGDQQLRGWSVAGLPGVINGYNERVAWGFTNIGDTQDLFLETRSETDPLQFKDGDQWYTARTETVKIPVSGREQDEDLTITHTINGPLISENPPISLSWSVQHLDGKGIDCILKFNRAMSCDEYARALDDFAAPSLNATFADIDGNIGFRTAGLIPIRGAGNGLIPSDGADPANRWQGFVPPQALPTAVNPEAGYLAAANARSTPLETARWSRRTTHLDIVSAGSNKCFPAAATSQSMTCASCRPTGMTVKPVFDAGDAGVRRSRNRNADRRRSDRLVG